jgi:hypothetical protein
VSVHPAEFTIIRPAVPHGTRSHGPSSERPEQGRRPPTHGLGRSAARSKFLVARPSTPTGARWPRGFVRIWLVSAMLTHALGALATGAFNPAEWPRLTLAVCIVFVAPCLALALAVLEGAFTGDGASPGGARG